MTTKKPTIAAIILSKNESSMIEACIDCLQWCNEIILVDDGSTDDTLLKAEDKEVKIISFKHKSFSRRREEGMKRSKSDWVIYIDSDERVTPTLAKEIVVQAEIGKFSAMRMKRENIYYGTKLSYGGWGDDYVTRIFKRTSLMGWIGNVHESPSYKGEVITLNTPLIHLTHRDTISGLYKTAAWTPIEAQELFNSKISKVTFFTLFRKGSMEFIRRALFKKGYKDGIVGLIESLVQSINRILVYIQIWEMQQKPTISQKYTQLEEEIKYLWSKSEDKSEKT